MGNLILGATLGFLVSLAVVFLPCFYWRDEVYSPIAENLLTAAIPIGVIAFMCVGGVIGASIDRHDVNRFVEQYNVTKVTIENSISNADLTGYERLALVEQVIEYNSTLESYKYDSQQWYGFMLPDSIMDVEPITFGG